MEGLPKISLNNIYLRVGISLMLLGVLGFTLLDYQDQLWDKAVLFISTIVLIFLGLKFLFPEDSE